VKVSVKETSKARLAKLAQAKIKSATTAPVLTSENDIVSSTDSSQDTTKTSETNNAMNIRGSMETSSTDGDSPVMPSKKAGE
jgi:hypothetical protein